MPKILSTWFVHAPNTKKCHREVGKGGGLRKLKKKEEIFLRLGLRFQGEKQIKTLYEAYLYVKKFEPECN